jgi:DNA-binding protein
MKQFYNKWYLKVNALHENKELLSSIAVHVCYKENRKSEHSFNFPWIVAWEGILTTLEAKQEEEKVLLRKLKETAEAIDTIEFLGRKYIEEIKKKHISADRTIVKTKEKISVEVPVVDIVGEEFEEKIKENNIVILKPKFYRDKEYVSLFQNEQYIGAIAHKNDTIDILTSLKDYYNSQFKVQLKKINKKSAIVELHIA